MMLPFNSTMIGKIKNFGLLLLALAFLACEIDTKLRVTGGNPPAFEMTGNGLLNSIRVRGHKRQREAIGENASIYWEINSKDDGRTVGRLGAIIYGKVPDGYEQKYPESGDAPKLEEGQHYYIRVSTSNANGTDGYFMILNGKVLFADYYTGLPEETHVSK